MTDIETLRAAYVAADATYIVARATKGDAV
jgi:hypothetical protein